MARTRIGVDVGSTAVRVAEVAVGDIPVVVRAAQVPLAPGVVESGEVRQPEAVAEALRKVWAKSGVKSKQVQLGVGNQRVVVREIALPWLPEKELRDTLAFQVQEFIPMASDEAVLDFDPLGELDQGGGGWCGSFWSRRTRGWSTPWSRPPSRPSSIPRASI